jgi:two-component system, response regulator / RNA-binding antiterminator
VLAQRDVVAAAKRLIMHKKAMSEPEAHRWLQDLAMKRGLKLPEAAQRVLDVESLMG